MLNPGGEGRRAAGRLTRHQALDHERQRSPMWRSSWAKTEGDDASSIRGFSSSSAATEGFSGAPRWKASSRSVHRWTSELILEDCFVPRREILLPGHWRPESRRLMLPDAGRANGHQLGARIGAAIACYECALRLLAPRGRCSRARSAATSSCSKKLVTMVVENHQRHSYFSLAARTFEGRRQDAPRAGEPRQDEQRLAGASRDRTG